MKEKLFGLLLTLAFMAPAFSQSVTVGSAGSGAQYPNLTAAILHFSGTSTASDGTTNTITFLDEGPFIEFNRIIINEARSGTDDLIIQGAEGIRPIIIADLTASTSKISMLHLRKIGLMHVKDLIIIPPKDGVVDQTTYVSKVGETGIEIICSSAGSTSITLENVLVSSNDGNNRPVASLDGLTSPTFTPSAVSFRDEGIIVQSNASAYTHYLEMKKLVVSGVSGDQGSDAVRGFPDGGAGSQWIIGPGCVFSYNNTRSAPVPILTTGNAAFQPGGTEGFEVHVRGTSNDPVKFVNNNLGGMHISDQAGALDLTTLSWVIIANNTGPGIRIGDQDTDLNLTNVTLASNGMILLSPANPNEGNITASNVIAAGNGEASNPDNIINLAPANFVSASTFSIQDSAIVLTGPYTANNVDDGGDGIRSNSAYTVTADNITSSNPAFASLDPASLSFALVTNSDYLMAGPGESPLVGGGSIVTSSVSDWQLFN